MNSVRKYVLRPFESDEQNSQSGQTEAKNVESNSTLESVKKKVKQTEPLKNFIKERARLKMENIFKIITNIALVNGYDSRRQIRASNGIFISNTDIIKLITHAMQPGKILRGEEEFVNLLREAKVDPNWLLNENIKSKLSTYSWYEKIVAQPKIIKQVEENPMFVEKTSPIQVKRKNDDDTNEIVVNKKRKLNWEYSDDE